MAPFALPTRAIASVLWYALSVALLYLFLRQSLRLLPDRRVRAGLLVVLVVLCTGKFWVKELACGRRRTRIGGDRRRRRGGGTDRAGDRLRLAGQPDRGGGLVSHGHRHHGT